MVKNTPSSEQKLIQALKGFAYNIGIGAADIASPHSLVSLSQNLLMKLFQKIFFFAMRVIKPWHRLSREVVDAPPKSSNSGWTGL